MIRQAFIDMEQMLDLRAVEPEIVDAPDARALPPAVGHGAPSWCSTTSASSTPPARSASPTSASRTPPGTTTALVGPSGAGKTTIVRLALRLLDPQDGRGAASTASTCATCSQASLRRAVALVPQDVALFNDTLCANIAFADPEASEAEVWAAAEAAELGPLHRGACPTRWRPGSASGG